MSGISYVIKGRITRRDTNRGVHGLRVEVWSEGGDCDVYLGSDLTNQDGSYSVTVCLAALGLECWDASNVYLKIRDRDCRLIYDGQADRRCREPSTRVVIDVALPPEPLYWHLGRPLSWAAINEPLIPEHVFDDIEEALALLPPGASPLHDPSAVLCITPPIEGFEQLLRDAWDALQGDLSAATRFRDVLQALCASQQESGVDPYQQLVDEVLTNACLEPRDECRPRDCELPQPCSRTACDCGARGCNGYDCAGFFVPQDKIMLLVMATLHVACGHAPTARRHMLALLDQLCRFELLGTLHRASVQAVLGDARSRLHLQDLLELVCARCGPGKRAQPACTPRRPLPCCESRVDERLIQCLREAAVAWCQVGCYRVDDVQPPRACPGETIVIRGCGFGQTEGAIAFEQKGGPGLGALVQPRQWCDDRIEVVVPQSAGCGLVPVLAVDTLEVCDRFVEYRPIGCIVSGFEGTSAEILKFGVRGYVGGECLDPGEPLHIRWRTCAADRVKVEIIDLETGIVIAQRSPAAANGRWDFTATNFTRTTRIAVRITVEGRCEPAITTRELTFVIQRPPNLSIDGMEITQAIQYYRSWLHLTDPSDRGPDNSLRLVTNKSAWVRVYLRSGQDPSFDSGQLPGVDGTLTVERRVGGVWSTIGTLPSQNGPTDAQDAYVSYDAERGNINASLNFVVPANLMNGLLRFTAQVASPFPCPGNSASGQVQVDVNLAQTLNAAFITIGYNGPDATRSSTLNLPAPTLAQCQAETDWTMLTYPLSGVPNVRLAGTFTTTTPLDDPTSGNGKCSPNWGSLLQQVANLVALDQGASPGTWVYYGIINAGIPRNNVSGCNGIATGGVAGRPRTYAHELGHKFGLPHSRCGSVGAGNPAYPVYEPYDLPIDIPAADPEETQWTMASTGEYGLDINTGNIANPNRAEDFMSYCDPRWISLYTHRRMINATELSPQMIPTGSGAATERVIRDPERDFERDREGLEPLVLVQGTIGVDGRIEVSTVARLRTRYMPGQGRQTPYIAQLLDEQGRILAQDVLYAYPRLGAVMSGPCEECGPVDGTLPLPVSFRAMLRDVAPGARLRIVLGDEVVWERERPPTPLRIAKATASLDERGNVELDWTLDGGPNQGPRRGRAARAAEVWVRWSSDGGETWHALTVGQTGSSFTVDREQLPSGQVTFQLLVNDGFHTTTAVTNPVMLPARPPVVTILYPRRGDQVYAERRLHLYGTASSVSGESLAGAPATWFIDGEPVARGLDAWVDNPGPGVHEVRLEVQEGELRGVATEWVEIMRTS